MFEVNYSVYFNYYLSEVGYYILFMLFSDFRDFRLEITNSSIWLVIIFDPLSLSNFSCYYYFKLLFVDAF